MKVIKNSSIYLGSSVLNKAIPFMLLPILTKFLSPEEYGTLSIFLIMISFFTAIVGMAINMNVSKYFFEYSQKQMALLLGNILIILCFTMSFFTVLMMVVTLFFNQIFSIPSFWIRLLPLLSFMFMVNLVNLTIFRNKGKAMMFGIFEVLNTVINLGVTILFLVVYNYGWHSRAVGIFVAYFCFFVVGLVYMKNTGYLDFHFDKKVIKTILGLSLPLIPHSLGSIVIAVSDRLFIEKMISLESVGIYSVGYMFGMIIMLFSDAFVKAWSPWFFKNLSNATPQVKLKIVKYTYIYIIAIFTMAILVSICSHLVLPYFVDESYASAGKYVFVISMSYAFFGVYQIFFPYLVHINKTAFLGLSTFLAAVINLILNYYFINRYGAIGAAYATLAAFIASSSMVFLYQKSRFEMPWSLKHNK